MKDPTINEERCAGCKDCLDSTAPTGGICVKTRNCPCHQTPPPSVSWAEILRKTGWWSHLETIGHRSLQEFLGMLEHRTESLLSNARTEERAKIAEEVRALKLLYVGQDLTISTCDTCGFPNDHRECMCSYNSAIDGVLSLLTKEEKN